MTLSDSKHPIWVTGAGGFIGGHLSQFLAEKGHRIVGFGRGEGRNFTAATGGAFLSGGVSTGTLDAALSTYGRPAAVYHLAGGATVGQSIANPIIDFEKNVISTACLLDALRRSAPEASVVMTSSAAVYGKGHSGPIRLDAAPAPSSPYGHHKHMAEELGQSYSTTYGQSIAAVRLFSVYGEGMRKQLLWDVCGRLAAGQTRIVLGGTGTEMRDWCHVSDVVRLLYRLLPSGRDGFAVYNGGASAAASVGEISQMVLDAWGGSHTLIFSGKSRPGDPFSLIAEPSDLPEDFSWRVAPAEGVGRYVDWYRAEVLRETAIRERFATP